MEFLYRIKIRTYAVILLGIALVLVVFTAVNSSRCSTMEEKIRTANLDNLALESEYEQLTAELKFIKSKEGIELYARALGMQMPGETRYSGQ